MLLMNYFLIAFALIMHLNSFASEMAITVDDPGMESVGQYSNEEINRRMLSTLKKHRIKAALFVCEKRVDSPAGMKLLRDWDRSGHWIGNHSYSHLNLHDKKITGQYYIQDIEKNIPIISTFKNFRPFFRFPFLKEGDTSEKRDLVRQFLKEKNLLNGYVTIDTSDWAISEKLKEAVKSGKKDLSKYRDYYIAHMMDRFKYYDGIATATLGRKIKHTILIHHNVLNALFLDDLIQALQKEKIVLIDVAKAYADAIYLEQPDYLPAGESLIWMLAKKKNPQIVDERYPAEDGKYIESEMNRLGL